MPVTENNPCAVRKDSELRRTRKKYLYIIENIRNTYMMGVISIVFV